jgi:hypothetical protein
LPPENEKKLATFAIVLGSLYTAVTAMLIFGVIASATVSHMSTARSLIQKLLHRRTETLSPHPHILLPVCRRDRDHNSNGSCANNYPLYAQGMGVSPSPFFPLTVVVKNDLITECTSIAEGGDNVTLWGVWSSDPGDNLTPSEAAQCVSFQNIMIPEPNI